MSPETHVLDQLSALLDGDLRPSERSAVKAHLAACASCRARHAELRGVVTLLAALPDSVPARRLVPRVAPAPAWLAPLRTLSTIASGISVFLFIASALLANIGFLSRSAASNGAPAAAPVPAAGGAAASRAESTAGPTLGVASADTAKQATAVPSGATFSASSAPPLADAARERATGTSDRTTSEVSTRGVALGPSPWLWLALAMATGVLAIALQRRLRST